MTRLKMHWQLVQGADGRKHLDMAWEAATGPGSAERFTPPNLPKCEAKIAPWHEICPVYKR